MQNGNPKGTPNDIKFHGIKEYANISGPLEQAVEDVKRAGFTVVPNCFSSELMDTATSKIHALYASQAEEVGGEAFLKEIGDHNVARALLAYDPFFLQFANNPTILEHMRQLIGERFILMLQNAPINRPHLAHQGRSWHRDLVHQHYVSSRPLGVTVTIALDDFTALNGAMYVVPGSHRFEEFPSLDYVKKHEVQVIAKRGSLLIFDSMLFHSAGLNTTDKSRDLVVQVYTQPFIKQQVDFPKMLGKDFTGNAEFRDILGFGTETASNVVEWRRRRSKAAPTM